ncbi:MAG: hypothetical protein ACK504_09885, partial [Bacteroidota bacterium]
MQNKGAIKIFAILLALACLFYLSFTWITSGVENDAKEYAEGIIASPLTISNAKAFANNNSTKELAYIDSIKTKTIDRYLDSVKKIPVYDLIIASYTYEECKKREINLGLDLRGGMNVTLEISVADILKNLSNNNTDAAFNKSINDATANLGKNNDDYLTVFEKTYRDNAPNGRLAPLFQTIELKGKVDFNASNDQVMAFLRKTVDEAITNSEATFRSRIDRFGVAQPNIQKLGSSGRILVELPGVKDKERVRELLQGTANLEFWETYENQEIAPFFEKANTKVKNILYPDFENNQDSSQVNDSISKAENIKVNDIDTLKTKKDSISKIAAISTPTLSDAEKQDTAVKNFLKRFPLYSLYSPLKAAVYQDEKSKGYSYIPG